MELFAAEVINSMKDGKADIKVVKSIADEYRALWANPKEPITYIEQKGFIAEMEVVKELGGVNSPNLIMQAWKGPERGLHDIATETWAVEVKSYSEEPPRVKINHIQQLAKIH